MLTIHELSEDCLNYCLAFLDVRDVGNVCFVSKRWSQLASSDIIWAFLCKNLWKGKQRHPFERWAELKSPSTTRRFRDALDKLVVVEKVNDIAESGITGSMLQTMYRSLLDPILEISSNSFSQGVKEEDRDEYNELLKDMEELRKQTRSYWRQKLNELIKAEEEQFGINIIVRKYAPISGCIRAEQIDLELNRCLTMFEDIPTEEFLMLNRNIEHKIQCNLQGRGLEKYGGSQYTLLSFKESYRASIEDAKREWITYEELRELSDWVQIWGDGINRPTQMSLARFVSGGAELIDNNKFFHCGEYLGLLGNRLIFLGVEYKATVSRNWCDWGWSITFHNMSPSLVMKSFDKNCILSPSLQDDIVIDLGQCEALRSPLAMLPRYALYPVSGVESKESEDENNMFSSYTRNYFL